MTESTPLPLPLPFTVRAAIARLLDACPECRGYAMMGGFSGPDPAVDCPACGALRKWVWKTYGVEFAVKT